MERILFTNSHTAKKWPMRYMGLAREVSTWSKDATKIGAVAVGEFGQVLSQGYNGFPRGIGDTQERLDNRDTKLKYVVHAEKNCIYNASLNGASLRGSSMYVYGLPICHECAKGIIQAGVKNVFMCYDTSRPLREWGESGELAKSMFDECGIVWSDVSDIWKAEHGTQHPTDH